MNMNIVLHGFLVGATNADGAPSSKPFSVSHQLINLIILFKLNLSNLMEILEWKTKMKVQSPIFTLKKN